MPRKNTGIKIIAIALLVLGIIFFHWSRPVEWLRQRVVALSAPIMRAAAGAGRRIGALAGGISGKDAAELRAENERLSAENFDRGKLAARVLALESALEFRDGAHVREVGARVLLYSSAGGRESLLLDQGAAAGVKKGDIVVDAHHLLVGEIADAGDDSSSVSIASNAGFVFPAVLSSADGAVLARGIGARAFSVELIPKNIAPRRGDFVARRLSGGAGTDRTILVGAITGDAVTSSGGFVRAEAVLTARPEMLDDVFIIPSSP